jgi:phenylalanyl-tRNA synthetase beta chain
MRVPLSWLRDYVDVDETPQQVAERLTFAGIEVEAIETIGSTHEGLVVGEVRSVEKHPNADKLTVCRVFDGVQELQVVCGAPNVRAGGKYPFARIGAVLEGGALKIKAAKLRGVESHGMLCAEDELGLSAKHEGLLALDDRWAAGTPLADVLGPPETVLELEITPNRPDCLGLIGVARELAAVHGRRLDVPSCTLQVSRSGERARVEVEDPEGCARYTARVLDSVKVGPSPDWMKRRLEHAGIRAINNVVDITNYVMLECGQPLHAFDQALLGEGRIVVRRARAGEKLATLDGLDRELDPSMLVIADASRPVAIAGVMGGAGSEIHNDTNTVLLESAWFQPLTVRATSRKLGLSTESSYRFERGVDIGGVDWASRRAAALLVEHAGARIAGEGIDVYPRPPAARALTCRFDRVRAVTGMDVSNEAIAKIFSGLELKVEKQDAAACRVQIPTFRADLEGEIDLIEEVARLHGLDKVPTPHPRSRLDAGGDDAAIRSVQSLKEVLAGLGLQEICNYSLVSESLSDLFDSSDRSDRLVLPRPISADQSILRTSLVPQLVESLGRNRARQMDRAALFELGRVFRKGETAWPREEERLAIGLMGPIGRLALEPRRAVSAEEAFLWLKGLWEALALAQRIDAGTLRETAVPWGERGAGFAIVVDGAELGVLGLVRREIRKEWRLTDPVAALDVPVAPLVARIHATTAYAALPSHPCVVRDMALIVDEKTRHEEILRIVREAAPPELERVELFDVFRGDSIGRGRKSMAYSLTYRSPARTLTDEDANGYHDLVKVALKRALSVEIRES